MNDKELVATSFYYEISRKDNKKPRYMGRGNYVCKCVEFFDLWYKHVKKYIPHTDILVVDNGSPIPYDTVKDRYDEVIIKRHDDQMDHHTGWCRQLLTILKTARELDYDVVYYVESDALIGFNPAKYRDYDFVSHGKWHDGAGVNQCFMKITKADFNIIDWLEPVYDIMINVDPESLYHNKPNEHMYLNYFAEVGFKRFMVERSVDISTRHPIPSVAFLDEEDLFIHDCDQHELSRFLQQTNIS